MTLVTPLTKLTHCLPCFVSPKAAVAKRQPVHVFQHVHAGPGDLPPPSPAPAPPGLQVLNLNALLPLHFAQQLPLLLDLLQECLVSSQLLLLQLFLESICSAERREREKLTSPDGSPPPCCHPKGRIRLSSQPFSHRTGELGEADHKIEQAFREAHLSPSQAAGV